MQRQPTKAEERLSGGGTAWSAGPCVSRGGVEAAASMRQGTRRARGGAGRAEARALAYAKECNLAAGLRLGRADILCVVLAGSLMASVRSVHECVRLVALHVDRVVTCGAAKPELEAGDAKFSVNS